MNYLRGGKWNLPKDPEELLKAQEEIKFYGLWDAFVGLPRSLMFENSTLLDDHQQLKLNKWLGCQKQIWKLLYKASVDGWGAARFHELCDDKGPTLTVIQAEKGHLFGGFSPISWQSSGNYIWDQGTWLFSLTNPTNTPCKIPNSIHMCGDQEQKFSTFHDASVGPTFGGGHDIGIVDRPNEELSYSGLGYNFIPEKGNPYAFFVGAVHFLVSEIEVFVPIQD